MGEILIIVEGITFGEFDSIKENLLLTYRDDPPPEEKEIRDAALFMQGDYDFSRILGETFRENRPLTYEFFIKENNFERRKTIETKYENMLLNQGRSRIYDTANPGYYFDGKCINAEVALDTTWQQLKLTITFDCYPYMVSELQEGHDIWDEFNLELDVSQITEFEVNGTENITLYNSGSASLAPKIKTTGAVKITKDNYTLEIDVPGTYSSEQLRLIYGENKLKLEGNATVKFVFHKELI